MSKKISIAVYSIELSEQREDKNKRKSYKKIKYEEFKKGNKSYVKFISEVIKDTLDDYQDDDVNKEIAKLYQVDGHEGIDEFKTALDGRLIYGKYGEIADIISTNGYHNPYSLKSEDAIVFPHYFYFHLPEDEYKAYLCIQRYGNSGVFSILKKQLEKHFKEKLEDNYRVKFHKLKPSDYIDQVNKEASRVSGITLTYKAEAANPIRELAESFDIVGETDLSEDGKIEVEVIQMIRFKSKLKQVSASVFGKKFAEHKKEFYEEVGVSESVQKSASETVDITYGNRKFKMEMNTMKDNAAYFDITDEVRVIDGIPNLEDLRKSVRNIMDAVHDVTF